MEVVEGSASYGGCDYDATIAAQYDSLHKDPKSLQEDLAIAGFLREFLGRFGRCGYRVQEQTHKLQITSNNINQLHPLGLC